MYVFIKSEENLWTVGHYTPGGAFVPESDYDKIEAAAKRVNYLNGGSSSPVHAPEKK